MVLAVGGSPNALVHVPAIMRCLGLSRPDWEDWDAFSRTTPFICRVMPNHPTLSIRELDHAGRIHAVMKELAPLLHLDAITVTGRSVGENIADARVLDRGVIRPIDEPFFADGGLVVLKGNLAPEGAIIKKSAVPASMMRHRGPARVCESEEEAMALLLEREVKPGDVLVVRNEGPKGAPGGRKVWLPLHTIVGMGLTESVALVTDGAFSGGNLGCGIGYVSPEAASGGPLAVVREGDMIEFDVAARKLTLAISEAELTERLAGWTPPIPKHTKGVLGMFALESYLLPQRGLRILNGSPSRPISTK